MNFEKDAILLVAEKIQLLKRKNQKPEDVQAQVISYLKLQAKNEIKNVEVDGIIIKNTSEIIPITLKSIKFDNYIIFEATREKAIIGLYERNCDCDMYDLKQLQTAWYKQVIKHAEIGYPDFYQFVKENNNYETFFPLFKQLSTELLKTIKEKIKETNESKFIDDLNQITSVLANFKNLCFAMKRLHKITNQILHIEMKTCCVSFLKMDLIANRQTSFKESCFLWIPFL